MTKRSFGDLEQAILKILQSGEKMNSREVQEKLGGDDKYTTVMTVMARLAKKNVLQREKNGMSYDYWISQKKAVSQSFLEKIKSRLFGVKTAEVVSYLVDQADDLTESELEEMEKMIQQAKKKRGINE